MTWFNRPPVITDLVPSDGLGVFSSDNGYWGRASLSTLLTFIQTYFASPQFTTTYSTPSATGFNVNCANTANNQWQVIAPAAGYAAGTLTLPAVAGCADGQEILVNITQAVTTFTVALNGATAALGAPTTLAANGFFRLRYQLAYTTWYRVG